jgi:hypothetical protein
VPNATVEICPATQQARLIDSRNIAEGSEIFINYIP